PLHRAHRARPSFPTRRSSDLMTPDGHFDYDAVTYAVASARAYYDSYYPHYAVNFGYGWGSPYGYRYAALYSTCYDPFFYDPFLRSEEHTSELQSRVDLVCRLL